MKRNIHADTHTFQQNAHLSMWQTLELADIPAVSYLRATCFQVAACVWMSQCLKKKKKVSYLCGCFFISQLIPGHSSGGKADSKRNPRACATTPSPPPIFFKASSISAAHYLAFHAQASVYFSCGSSFFLLCCCYSLSSAIRWGCIAATNGRTMLLCWRIECCGNSWQRKITQAAALCQFFAKKKKKAIFLNISTKCNCNLQVFPLNGLKRINRNSCKIPLFRGKWRDTFSYTNLHFNLVLWKINNNYLWKIFFSSSSVQS